VAEGLIALAKAGQRNPEHYGVYKGHSILDCAEGRCAWVRWRKLVMGFLTT
jgi:hypothetical protein